MNNQLKKTYNYSIKLLAMREHSLCELRVKLLQRFSKDDVELILLRVKKEGWQSDLRFAEMWVRSRSNKGFGPVIIEYELKKKGVGLSTIQDVLSTFEESQSWEGLARYVYEKKYKGVSCTSFSDVAKRKQFLKRRGFVRDHYAKIPFSF
jgi:regulatory protein